jgi:thiol-disulfide isomerase/thioredoxin
MREYDVRVASFHHFFMRSRFLLVLGSMALLSACESEYITEPIADDVASSVPVFVSSSIPVQSSQAAMSSAAMQKEGISKSEMQASEAMMASSAMMQKDAMPKSAMPVEQQASSQAQAMAKGSYSVYQEGVIGNGKTSLLFFHAAWCPICKTGNQKLTAWYAANSYPISTYKVDYDTYTDLKQRYGVTYQHTFVLIDGQGNAIQTIQGPSDAELQSLISLP